MGATRASRPVNASDMTEIVRSLSNTNYARDAPVRSMIAR
jgi:hypothetical protein